MTRAMIIAAAWFSSQVRALTPRVQANRGNMSQVRSLPPIVSERSKLLILGSMPGERSLKAGEYYAYPRNAFWPIMGQVFRRRPMAVLPGKGGDPSVGRRRSLGYPERV